MKLYFLHIIVLLIIFSTSLIFADVNSIMQQGNTYYKNNQYQLAVDEYNKLIEQGYEGVSIFYNLGNAHYRLGHIGFAILYYEKALKLSPGDEDLKHNLAVANRSIKDKVDTLPPFFIFNIWEDLLASFSTSGWTIVAYIIFILLLFCIIAYFFSRNVNQQRISFFSAIGTGIILILVIVLLTVKINKEFKIKDAIILDSTVMVKSSPDSASKDEFVVHEGLKVRIEDNIDNWFKIRLADGKIGWVTVKSVGQI